MRSYQRFVSRLELVGLLSDVEKHSLALHVTLKDLYSGSGRSSPSIAYARRAVYGWLSLQGKGINEIARLFDRAPSGVLKLMNAGHPSVRRPFTNPDSRTHICEGCLPKKMRESVLSRSVRTLCRVCFQDTATLVVRRSTIDAIRGDIK